jgi:hypothetical protein
MATTSGVRTAQTGVSALRNLSSAFLEAADQRNLLSPRALAYVLVPMILRPLLPELLQTLPQKKSGLGNALVFFAGSLDLALSHEVLEASRKCAAAIFPRRHWRHSEPGEPPE